MKTSKGLEIKKKIIYAFDPWKRIELAHEGDVKNTIK